MLGSRQAHRCSGAAARELLARSHRAAAARWRLSQSAYHPKSTHCSQASPLPGSASLPVHCWMKFCASTPLCGCGPPFAPSRAADWQDVSWAGPRAPHQASRRCIARKRPCLRPERAVLSQARTRLVSYALQQAVGEPARGRRAGPQRCLHARGQGAKVWATGWNKVEGLPGGEPEAPKRSGRCSTAHFLCTGPFVAALAGASQFQHFSSNIPPGCCSAVETRLLPAAQRDCGVRSKQRGSRTWALSVSRRLQSGLQTIALLASLVSLPTAAAAMLCCRPDAHGTVLCGLCCYFLRLSSAVVSCTTQSRVGGLLYSSRTLRSPAVPRKPGCES